MDESSASVAEDATQLLRRNKQSLRTIIRSRIKAAYPKNNDNNTTTTASAAESDQPSLLSAQSNQVFSRLFNLPQYKDAKSIGFFLSMPWGEIQTKHAIQQIVKDGKVLYVPRVGLDFELCDMDLIRCDATTTSTTAVTTSSNTGNVDNAAARDGGAAAATDGEDMFYDFWPRNKWGIPEPPVTSTNVAKPGDIDLLIVPGLAFDTNGHRLGQGKGYYDRFIAKMREGATNNHLGNDADVVTTGGQVDENTTAKPLLVGVCLEEQFLHELPHSIAFESGFGSKGIIPISDHDYIMDIVLTPSRALILRNVNP